MAFSIRKRYGSVRSIPPVVETHLRPCYNRPREKKGKEVVAMCGIVGYTGQEQAGPILLDGLEHL
jgi:hypothetical protein